MKQDVSAVLIEIMDMLKVIADGQQQLEKEVRELREEQKKLKEEVKLSNFVLNNISLRNEIIN